MVSIRYWLQKKIRPTSVLGFFVYNIYYNLFTFYKQLYFFYPQKNYYVGHLFVYGKKHYKFHLSCKSAITFIYELYIKNVYLKNINLDEGDYVLDIGANAGLFSVMASEVVGSFGKVISIEPSKDNVSNIKKNFKYNYVNNGVIVNKGTYFKKDTLKFYLHEQDFCNTMYEDEIDKGNISGKVIIEVDTVENILANLKIDFNKINFIKIDNEGAELDTLKGMKNILKNKNLRVLIPDLSKDDKIYPEILLYLKERDFKIKKNELPRIFAFK